MPLPKPRSHKTAAPIHMTHPAVRVANALEGGPDPDDPTWTPRDVEEILRGTLQAYLSQPLRLRDWPMDLRAEMPDVLQNYWENYGKKDPDLKARPRPTGRQLDEADRAAVWLLWLKPRPRKVVSARLFGVRWRMIEGFTGQNRRWLKPNVYDRSLSIIAVRLEREKIYFKKDFPNVRNFAR